MPLHPFLGGCEALRPAVCLPLTSQTALTRPRAEMCCQGEGGTGNDFPSLRSERGLSSCPFMPGSRGAREVTKVSWSGTNYPCS